MSVPLISLRGALSIWRRHFEVYRKTALLNFLPPMTEPLVYLIAFGYGLSPLVGQITLKGMQFEYMRFLAGGMVAVGVLFQSFIEGAYNSFVRLNFQRSWHAQLTTPLTFNDIFAGELLWTATKGIIAGIITSTVAIILGVMSVGEFLQISPFILLGSFVFGALGLWSTGWSKRIEYINIPLFLFCIPMFSFCGAYFPRDTLPAGLRVVADNLPLAPLADLLRTPLVGYEGAPLATLTLSLWCILFVTGAWRSIWRRIYG
jgi:lipooligosaccharide transport system permease protein